MATTRVTRTGGAADAPDAGAVTEAEFSETGGPVVVTATPPVPTVVTPTVVPVGMPAVAAPEPPRDPRADALAALLSPPPTVVSDLAPAPAPRIMPVWTGTTQDWSTPGDPDAVNKAVPGRYIVWADLYPRMYGDVRRSARRGDILILDDDDRTAQDVRYGHLIPER